MLSRMREPQIRRENVLLSHDPQRSSLHALLSVEDQGRTETGRVLERLGFRPEGSRISWVRRLRGDELGATCTRVANELGDSALWDLGRVFTNRCDPLPVTHDHLPTCWNGRFVLHVRGTPRCLVFDRAAEDGEIHRLYEAEDLAYMNQEFNPSE